MTIKRDVKKNIKPLILLFVLGFMGILAVAALLPQMLSQQSVPLPIPVYLLQLISIVQSSILLLVMIFVGAIFAKKVALTSPVIFAIAHSGDAFQALKPQLVPALVGGVLGGGFILAFAGMLYEYLPTDFINAAENVAIPWYTKVLYGGITEELLMRWGLMSFVVWASYRITQKNGTDIRSHNYIFGIVISAIIFGLGHLPVAFVYSPEITVPLVAYIILGNAGFGLIGGYLYWKHGLECAIGAHMMAHVTMILAGV